MGKANSGNDPLILFRAIYGDAIDVNKIDDIIASEPFGDVNSIADKVLAFLKQGDNFADGGRIGYRSGGIFKGLKGIQFGRVQKDLTKKYKDEGMEFMEALQKGSDEGLEIINEKKLNFLNGKMNEVNIYSDDYVKLIDEHIRIVEPDFYKDIKRWEGTRPDLADKTRASFFPDWAEARYGKNYMGVLQKQQAKAINESIDPNFKEPLSSADQMVSDIDDMNKANIDDLFGIRKKNADGGRIGYRSGGIGKGIAELLKLGNKKFGKDTIKIADDMNRPESALLRDEFAAFNERNAVPAMEGSFTKAEVVIERMKNSLKNALGKTDADSKYVKETFPNMIKELEVKPELGNNPNVWKMFSEDLPKNQRVVVHSDDSVSFFRQSNFGPQNIKTTMKFAEENNISVKEASRILKMEPEDRILEITRLKAIRQMKKGGLARILEM